jgi:hypothetical protein
MAAPFRLSDHEEVDDAFMLAAATPPVVNPG